MRTLVLSDASLSEQLTGVFVLPGGAVPPSLSDPAVVRVTHSSGATRFRCWQTQESSQSGMAIKADDACQLQ